MAISVILAGLTIFLAVIAIWGYTQIRNDARQQAHETAREEVPPIAAQAARRETQDWLAAASSPKTGDIAGALGRGTNDDIEDAQG